MDVGILSWVRGKMSMLNKNEEIEKVKIKVVVIGRSPHSIDLTRIKKWKSSVFQITGGIETFPLRCDSDGEDWDYSDVLLRENLPPLNGEDFLIALVTVPLEQNWYSRRLGDKKIVFSFHEIGEILRGDNIPLENAVLRVIYAYTMLYKRSGNKIPKHDEAVGFTHDETRGCLFDMNGIKRDIVESCHEPIICDACDHKSRNEYVSSEVLGQIKNEIRKIRKPLYYKAAGFVKANPLTALSISSVFAIIIGAAGSIFGSILIDAIKLL